VRTFKFRGGGGPFFWGSCGGCAESDRPINRQSERAKRIEVMIHQVSW
jgi:hypothetical protein